MNYYLLYYLDFEPCVHAINSVTDCMRQEIDEKRSWHAEFLEFKKVFDLLHPPLLLNKVLLHGFSGLVYKIIWHNLILARDGILCKSVRKKHYLPITTRFLQGSILRPFLFFVHSNNLQVMYKIAIGWQSSLMTHRYSNQEKTLTCCYSRI